MKTDICRHCGRPVEWAHYVGEADRWFHKGTGTRYCRGNDEGKSLFRAEAAENIAIVRDER